MAKRNEPYVSIMAIDPGLNALGISLGYYYPRKARLVIQEYSTIHANSLAKQEHSKEVKMYGSLISLFTCEEVIEEYYNKWNPDYIVTEDAFYNPRMPNAFLSLKLCINAIQRVLYKYQKTLYRIPPSNIKQAIFGNGLATKAAVQEGIANHDDIAFIDTKKKQLAKMSEHEADSVAVCYAFTQIHLPDLQLQKIN